MSFENIIKYLDEFKRCYDIYKERLLGVSFNYSIASTEKKSLSFKFDEPCCLHLFGIQLGKTKELFYEFPQIFGINKATVENLKAVDVLKILYSKADDLKNYIREYLKSSHHTMNDSDTSFMYSFRCCLSDYCLEKLSAMEQLSCDFNHSKFRELIISGKANDAICFVHDDDILTFLLRSDGNKNNQYVVSVRYSSISDPRLEFMGKNSRIFLVSKRFCRRDNSEIRHYIPYSTIDYVSKTIAVARMISKSSNIKVDTSAFTDKLLSTYKYIRNNYGMEPDDILGFLAAIRSGRGFCVARKSYVVEAYTALLRSKKFYKESSNSLNEQVENLKMQISSLEQEINEMKSRKNSYYRRYTEASDENKNLSNSVNDLLAQVDTLKKRLDVAEKKANMYLNANSGLICNNNNLRALLKRNKDATDKLLAEDSRLRDIIAALDYQVSQLQLELDNLRRTLKIFSDYSTDNVGELNEIYCAVNSYVRLAYNISISFDEFKQIAFDSNFAGVYDFIKGNDECKQYYEMLIKKIVEFVEQRKIEMLKMNATYKKRVYKNLKFNPKALCRVLAPAVLLNSNSKRIKNSKCKILKRSPEDLVCALEELDPKYVDTLFRYYSKFNNSDINNNDVSNAFSSLNSYFNKYDRMFGELIPEKFEAVIGDLEDDRDKLIMQLRYGLYDSNKYSVNEINRFLIERKYKTTNIYEMARIFNDVLYEYLHRKGITRRHGVTQRRKK